MCFLVLLHVYGKYLLELEEEFGAGLQITVN